MSGSQGDRLLPGEAASMKGTVYPRPGKKVIDAKTGKARLAPVRKGETYTDARGRVRTATRDSTWAYQFTRGSKKAGNRKHHKKGGFRTRTECESALAGALSKVGQGDLRVLVKPSTQMLRTYLQGWVDSRRGDLKPSTLVGYQAVVDAWIVPHLGGCSLSEITPELLVSLYGRLRERGGRKTQSYPEGRPLGSRSVQSVHVLLSMALSDAVEAGALPGNPVERIPKRQRPKHRNRRQSGKHWNAEQAARFVSKTADDRLLPLWSTLLDSAMRRGEVCALRWPRVDLDTGLVTVAVNRVHAGREIVEGTTKSDRQRTFELDRRTVTALKTWRKQLAKEKLAAGESWAGDLETGYVFVDQTGQPLRPDSLNYAFEKACKSAGVPPLSPHGLRHTSATLALARGVPPHVVQERLGHSDIAITLGLYSHVVPGQQQDAAQAIGDAIYGAGD